MRGPGPPPSQRADLSHHLVDIPVGDDGEIVAARAWAFGAAGVEVLGGRLRVAFTDHGAAAAAAAALGGTAPVETADDAGLDEWRAHATAVTAGPFVVHPPWLAPPSDTIALSIDPGHAFGSGSHPSTRLALRGLAATVVPGRRVLDVGCGSGVLAVAASRLGAEVVATDVDPEARRATAANAAANGATAAVEVVGAGEQTGRFDTVVVNMTIDLHESVAPVVLDHLADDGVVVVAGVLAGPQEARAAQAYACAVRKRLVEDEWVGLVLR